MKRYAGLVLMLLILAALVAVLPAQAARGGEQGSPSPDPAASAGNGQAAGAGNGEPDPDMPEAARGTGSATGGNAPVTTGTAQPSSARQADGTGGSPAGEGSSPENAPAAGARGNAANQGSSKAGTNGAATGSPEGSGSPGTKGPAESTGSGVIPAAGTHGNREMVKGAGVQGGITVARIAPVSGQGAGPGPTPGHGPFPPRNQRGIPVQSPGYPCGPAQPAPLPAAPGPVRDEPKDESLPRQKSRRSGVMPPLPENFVVPENAPPVPPEALFPFNLLLAGGFRRISGKNVLEHEARQVICKTVTALPGADLKTVAAMTGINENTLRYHLDRLVATGTIAVFARPGIVRYFPNRGAYTQFEHRVFHYLWTETPRQIVWLLYRDPGRTRQELADALGIAGPSVTRQMENLIQDGIVENRSPGRSNHYFLTAGTSVVLEKAMRQARVNAQGGSAPAPLPVTST